MCNLLKQSFDLQGREIELLTAEFGQENIETVLICIAEQRTPTGLRVAIQPTYEMVRDMLECMHRRLGVGENRITGEEVFYHHPDHVLCEHEFVDMTNEVITGGEVCLNCGKLRPSQRWPEGSTQCPSCKQISVVLMDGCHTCLNCGHSKPIEESEKK